jgi:ParB/RepB/Spo0J family partition protein
MAMKVDVQFGEASRKDILSIDPRNILPPRIGGRAVTVSQEKVEELAASFLEVGQLQPIRVTRYKDTPEGNFEVIAGDTRRRAALYLVEQGHPFSMKVEVVKGITPADAFIQTVIENAERHATSPVDDAVNAAYLIEKMNWDQAKVAALYKKSEAWVGQLLKVNDLPAKAKKLMHEKILSQAAAWELFELGEEEMDEVLASVPVEVEKKTGKKAITKSAVVATKRAVSEKREAEGKATTGEKKPRTVREIRAAFAWIAETPDAISPEASSYAVSIFAKKMLAYIEGRIGEPKMFEHLEKLAAGETLKEGKELKASMK